MHNWIDGRKISNSKSILTFSFTSRHLNPQIKNEFELKTFSQLPVIKEEAFISKDEVEVSQELLQNLNGHLKGLEKKQNAKLITKHHPLVNINCLMNVEVKQAPAIWNTNFGKRLINKKNAEENLDSSSDVERISSNYTASDKNKFRDYQHFKFTSKQKCKQARNIRYGGGDKVNAKGLKINVRKSKKLEKNNQNLLKKSLGEEKNFLEKKSKFWLSEKFQEASSKATLKEKETVSSFSKKQKFLTECVRNILDCYSTQVTCEYCNEKLPDIKEFNVHKMQHEIEKEICLLCDKVFYNSKKFFQHLLTHESVDHFSCKKCKKYFPDIKTFKQHCHNSHLIPSDNIIKKNPSNFDIVEEQLPKFECKQCRAGFPVKRKLKIIEDKRSSLYKSFES